MTKRPHYALINLGGGHWLGGHHYYQHILRALAALPDAERDFDLTYLVAEPLDPAVEADLARVCRVVVAPEALNPSRAPIARASRWLRQRFLGIRHPALHDLLLREKIDFAYPCATGGEDRGGYRTAHWIADLQFKHFPQFQLPSVRAAQQVYLEDIAAHAQTIVVSSEYGERDCNHQYPATIGRTFVMPFRVMPSVEPYGSLTVDAPALYNLPARFFVLSNQFWQNKNHLMVIEAVALLKARGVDVTIVCTGHVYDPRLPTYSDRIFARLHELGVANRVRILGAVPREHQLDLLRRAVAVVQPSLFEGWNTSIEEARFFGRSAIVSDIPVHREQAWCGSSFFNLADPASLADALSAAWEAGGDGSIATETEATARDAYLGEVQIFARRFLALAQLR